MTDNELQTSFEAVRAGDDIFRIASPVISVREGDDTRVWGTMFTIGRGIGLTARHVVVSLLKEYDGIEAMEDRYYGVDFKRSFQILGLVDQGKNSTVPLRVGGVLIPKSIDVAILFLREDNEDPTKFSWKRPRIRLMPPRVGTKISAVGFPATTISKNSNDIRPTIDLKPMRATGIVKEVHFKWRDRVMLPFPCYETNARFDGAMSGGPVLDETGAVCGVVCSSIPASTEQSAHSSYVSTLWPIAGAHVSDRDSELMLIDLMRSGVIHAVDADRITVERSQAYRANVVVKPQPVDWGCQLTFIPKR